MAPAPPPPHAAATDAPPPPVTVLMALYQGAGFLGAQLDSIAAQNQPWRLIVADDGSTDAGPAIVEDFAAAHPGRVTLTRGPGAGAAANFRALLGVVGPDVPYAALSDQDDVWRPEKLSRAVAALQALPHPAVPALYCSRVTICDRDLRPIGLSRLPQRSPSFRHALVQNLVQGNTVVLNRAALDLVGAAGPRTGPVVMHDWWLYQLVTGAGGQVIHDPTPSLAYRQHGANVVGANDGPAARLASLRRMLAGRHRDWSRANLGALDAVRPLLTPDNRRLLEDFRALTGPGPLRRLSALRRGGFYRQGALSQAALWVAAALGRV